MALPAQMIMVLMRYASPPFAGSAGGVFLECASIVSCISRNCKARLCYLYQKTEKTCGQENTPYFSGMGHLLNNYDTLCKKLIDKSPLTGYHTERLSASLRWKNLIGFACVDAMFRRETADFECPDNSETQERTVG